MDLHGRVRYALDNAPVVGTVPNGDVVFRLGPNRGDSTPVCLDPTYRPDYIGEVTLDWKDHPEALAELADALTDVADLGKSTEEILATQGHEEEHIEAAMALGATVIRMGIQVLRPSVNSKVRRIDAHVRYPNFRTTKLGLGLTMAYPLEPSPIDMENLATLNYLSVQQVGRAVTRFNRSRNASQITYPYPRSYRRFGVFRQAQR